MKRTLKQEKNWSPHYPESNEGKVRLKESELQTYMLERRAGIFVSDDPVECPACFWIDREHVYLRTNWSLWSTVSLSNPEQVMALCNARYCQITNTINNAIKDFTAPVYHIEALPEDLFCGEENDSDKQENEDDDDFSVFQNCFNLISDIAKDISDDLTVLPALEIEGDRASFVIMDIGHVFIMDILPEDRDFVFTPPDEESPDYVIEWPTNRIPLDFINKLRRMKMNLSREYTGSIVSIGFLANSDTIEELRSITESEGSSDLTLLSYADLKDGLAAVFSSKMNMDHETIAERVKEIIAEHLEIDASRVQEDTLLVNDLGTDELDSVEICMAIEDAFGFFFPDDEFSRFRTVKDIVDFIETHQG